MRSQSRDRASLPPMGNHENPIRDLAIVALACAGALVHACSEPAQPYLTGAEWLIVEDEEGEHSCEGSTLGFTERQPSAVGVEADSPTGCRRFCAPDR